MSWVRLAAVVLAVLPMTVMAKGLSEERAQKVEPALTTDLSAAGFEESAKQLDILPTTHKLLNYDVPAKKKVGDADLTGTETYMERKPLIDEDRKQPYRAFMPSLSGLTGLIDVPVAYTQPAKTFVATYQHESVSADHSWWRLPYQAISSDMSFMSLNYGATNNIELSLDGEIWDKSIRYNDEVLFTNPLFAEKNLKFVGVGSKWTFPFGSTQVERIWFGLGFRTQLFQRSNRDVTEIHEYDRFSNIFFTASTKATRELWGHFMVKYVSYDFAGGRAPSGATATFAGVSPTNFWTQWGGAAEWYIFPDLEVFTELLRDANVIFLDEDGPFNQFNWNVGARYHQKDWGVGLFAKRINHRGYSDNGFQAAIRF